ncbi:RNA deprotection pyrophosphohydrolase [Peribacillus sp. SCS-26]|uniref:RNA deprotection pyrophosphohydrolase n=1 Tax=Paraperibacillus marinus TaxID=3115295 RepID=UPI0039059F9B
MGIVREFIDRNGCRVQFSSGEGWMLDRARHVWVVCTYRGKWVLTKHKERGLEFPGGKAEGSETLEEACTREVYEETGGLAGKLVYLGSYRVVCGREDFYKAVFYTNLRGLKQKEDYLETEGPLLAAAFPKNLEASEDYSYIMKDELLPICLGIVEKMGLNR